ncbi:MAG: HEAT repeat domain-containing protein [Candidatus Hydrogenedentes bacterium]|nr:HEAT repeat domain-containing protein [Candidatus Hydrogenedentota bacterium]
MSKRFRFECAILALAALMAVAARGADVDGLVQALGGDDEIARSQARQFLAREGANAVPKVLPLLSSPDANVWNAAFNVLADLATAVSTPGREEEREAVTNDLMTLVAPSQSAEIKERGLRLLPLVIPEGHSVAPVAALLKDPELKEKARAALQESGTAVACKALVAALSKAGPDFQCALLNSIGALHNEKSVSAVARYTKSKDAKVRAAAARALSWTGSAARAKSVETVYGNATPDTAFDAADAMIRLADAAAVRRSDLQTANRIYQTVLKTGKDRTVRGAALVGMARHGDDAAAEAIVSALRGDDGRELEPMVLAAYENAKGPAVVKSALAIYPQVSREMKIGLLGVFGRARAPEFLDVLKTASQDGDATVRRTAYVALADSQLPEAVNALASAAGTANVDDKSVAVNELKRLAATLEASGHDQAAGAAYLALYRVANSSEMQKLALIGVARHPTADSSDTLIKAAIAGELKDVSAATLASLAKNLADAKRTEEANQIVAQLMNKAVSPEAIADIIKVTQATKSVPDVGHRLGFVMKWTLTGPFPWSQADGFKVIRVNEPNVDLKASYKSGGKDIAWKKFDTADPSGIVDLTTALGVQANATGYGVATVTVPVPTDAVARMGSDDGIKLWVNSAVAHENNTDRGTQIDQDKAPVKLKAGVNTLLVEVTQGGGGWNFCLRLTDKDGKPLAFTEAP